MIKQKRNGWGLMRRVLACCLLLLTFILSSNGLAQDKIVSPWEEVVPTARFGYGSLLSVYWSPLTGQLAASSERGLQYYDEDLTIQGERDFGDTPNQGVIFSPDMRFVALQEAQGLIVRNTYTWEPIVALNTFTAPSWSPDSKRLALWMDGVLQIWDVERAMVLFKLTQLISDGAAVQWSPDGQVIAVPAGETIVMVNALTGDIVRIHDFAQINDFQWSRDGRWFIIAGLRDPLPFDYKHPLKATQLVRLDAVTGEMVMTYDLAQGQPTNNIYTTSSPVSISPDGRYVSAPLSYAPNLDYEYGWQNMGMAIYDLETGRGVSRPNHITPIAYPVTYTSWSPDSNRFATSNGSTLQIFEVATGQQVADLPAYIAVTGQTVWTNDGKGLIAAGGLWDVSGEFPDYLRAQNIPTPAQDRFTAPFKPYCTMRERWECPEFMVPPTFIFDYTHPPYDWKLLQWFPERDLAISYEIDIEYPDTPEYDDNIPPEERYILWDIGTGKKIDKRVYLGGQTAWIYDLDNVPYVESESRAFNILRNTRFVMIGDDEIVDLRTEEVFPLQGTERWEYREVWFSPDGRQIYAYDTDSRFKAFDPLTGEMLYQTAPAPRGSLWYTADLTLTFVQDGSGTLYIYKTDTGDLVLETYTANPAPLLLWNEDRTRLAVGGDNRAIIIFDIASQERLGTLRGHQSSIASMAWNPACDYSRMEDCRHVFASSDADGQVIIWGTERREQLVRAMPDAPAAPIHDLPIAEVDFGTLTPLWTYISFTDEYGKEQAQTIRWTDAGIRINDNTYYTPGFDDLRDVPDGILWMRPSDIAPDGRMLANNGVVYDAEGDALAQVVSSKVTNAVFNPSAERVITTEQDSSENTLSGWIREYSAASGQFIRYWGGGNPGFRHLAYSPDQKWIATVTTPYYNSGARVQIWFTDRFNTQFSSLIGHSKPITALYWDGEEIVTSSLDGSVRRWDIRTALPLARWNHPEGAIITQMEWLDEDTFIVSAGKSLYFLNAATLEVEHMLEGLGGGHFDWSPDKASITVIGGDSIVRVINLTTEIVVAQETGHMPTITHLEWQPNGETLAVARVDGSIALMDSVHGTLIRVLRAYGPAIHSIAWSPDSSKLLLDLVDGPIHLIDGTTGDLLGEIDNPWRREGVWWNPDGTQIAYGTYPDTVHNPPELAQSLLNIHAVDGTLLHSFNLEWADYTFLHRNNPITLSWSDDAAHIAGFYKNRLRVWHIASGKVVSDNETSSSVSLALWEDDALRFWNTNSSWRLDVPTDTLTQLSAEGLPLGTERRADGHVLLANNLIVHITSNYNLQSLSQSYTAAAWHPTCWTTDCPAVLAIANGSTVTLLGYPNQARTIAEARP